MGDAFRLSVVETLDDGSTNVLSADSQVAWSGPPIVRALPMGSEPTESILPNGGSSPTTMWIENPEHFEAAELAGVLWVLDPGTGPEKAVEVHASITGPTPGEVVIHLPLGPSPEGDVSRGQALYGANCAGCHGATGHGNDAFPGLNAEEGHVAGDGWSTAVFTMAARSDMDDMGVSLDASMPKWLTRPSATGGLVTTQDFADCYAFLKTQHH